MFPPDGPRTGGPLIHLLKSGCAAATNGPAWPGHGEPQASRASPRCRTQPKAPSDQRMHRQTGSDMAGTCLSLLKEYSRSDTAPVRLRLD